MDDQSLNRELQSALDVDPSPEFLAKVRARIAAEPRPSRWRLAWVMMPAVAAIVLVAMLWPPPEAPMPVRIASAPGPIAQADPPAPEQPPTASAPVRRAARRVVAEPRPPAVVLNAAEVAAFNRLVSRIEMGALPVGDDVLEPPDLPAEIEFAPITIAPIAFVVTAEQGELQ